VPRARAITVEYLDEHAESKRVEAVGWQHEIDHLAGVLYVDRMHTRTLTTLENLERFWKDLPTPGVLAKLKSGLGNRGPYV